MALTKPILNTVPAWDVSDGYTFTFSINGGDQVVGNTLYIRNNTTNEVVFTQAVTSYIFSNTVPPNTSGLTNGTYYNAYITTTNVNGDISVASNIVQFYCYTTPTFVFTNVASGDIIENVQFTPTIRYNQAQDELLNSYTINLLNAEQIQIATSGVQYVGSTTSPPTTISYTFTGFEDNTSYYLEATGYTINGTPISTELINFATSFTLPSAFTVFELENNCDKGYITIQSNAMIVDGISNPNPPVYIENEEVDLTASGSWVEWNSNYEINGNFTTKVWFRNANKNSTLLMFENQNQQSIVLGYYVDSNDDTKVYVDLLVDGNYYIFSPSITAPLADVVCCVQIRRIDNIYDLMFEEVV